MVSGSISFPSRGAFHLSLTVLVHYRSPGYLALGSGLPSFPTGSSCPVVLRIPRVDCALSNTGLSPSTAGLSRLALLETQFGNYSELLPRSHSVLQLSVYNAGRLHTYTEFGLFPVRSPLLRELFLFFGVLRCFSSPTCLTLPSKGGVPAHHGGGLPHSEISGSACQRLPGAFRSVTTSFFGPGCQGIHHMPFLACDTPPSAPLLHSLCPSRNAARNRIAEESVHEHFLTRIVVVTHLTLDRCRCVVLVRNWFPTASTSAVLLVEYDVCRSIRLLLVAWYSLGNVLLQWVTPSVSLPVGLMFPLPRSLPRWLLRSHSPFADRQSPPM